MPGSQALLLLAVLLPSVAQADASVPARQAIPSASSLAHLFETTCSILKTKVSRAEAARRLGRDPSRPLGEKPDSIPMIDPERKLRLVPPVPSVRYVDLDVSLNDDDVVDVILIAFVKPRTLGELRRLFPGKRTSCYITDGEGIIECLAFTRDLGDGLRCELHAVVPTERPDDSSPRVDNVDLLVR
jgi:hypothetical protein